MKKLIASLITIFAIHFSSKAQIVLNGSFAASGTNWACGVETNPESTYGGPTAQRVAEVDAAAGLCQTISGLTIGGMYRLSYGFSRRTGGCPSPNPTNIVVTVSGGVLTRNDSRTNTTFLLTSTTYVFVATATSHVINFSAGAGFGGSTCGAIIDNVSVVLSPLPIELVSFTATKNNKVVDIKWETASELNNDYFEVEKSKNGIDFETLTYVKGAGNSTVRLNYKTVDENPFNGISYYRLKQVDLDQTFTYSQIQSVEFEKGKNFAFDIFPNPSEGNTINVSFENADNGEVLVVVFDVTGKESYSKVLITNEANNAVYAIDPSNTLAPGVYLITATSNQKIYSKRLIVK